MDAESKVPPTSGRMLLREVDRQKKASASAQLKESQKSEEKIDSQGAEILVEQKVEEKPKEVRIEAKAVQKKKPSGLPVATKVVGKKPVKKVVKKAR